MDIEFLILNMRKVLDDMEFEDLITFITNILKESGASFFKEFLSIILEKFTKGEFKFDEVE